MELFLDFLFRWGHILFGITWIGLLYYFNFIQTEYFKEAEEMARKDAVAKLAPRALWWFRWAAFFTFLTGLYLLDAIKMKLNVDIIFGATMGTLCKRHDCIIQSEKIGRSSAKRSGLFTRRMSIF